MASIETIEASSYNQNLDFSSGLDKGNGFAVSRFDASVMKTLAKQAYEQRKMREAERIVHDQDPHARVRYWNEEFEKDQHEAIRKDVERRIGHAVREFLARLDVYGRLSDGIDTKFKIYGKNNEQLLKLLSENGYISPEMAEQGELDLAGAFAGQVLTSKNIPAAQKHVLVGAHRGITIDVVRGDIQNYFEQDSQQ